MEHKIIISLFILCMCLSICVGMFCHYIGYIKGFKKCKKIDDDIIKELAKKYNLDN